MKDFEEN